MNVREIQDLFVYTEWANGLVLDAAQALTHEQLLQDAKISHKSILGTLAHMGGAEWVWLERWHGNSVTAPDVWKPWTAEHCGGLDKLRGTWEGIYEKRRTYLSRLSDADLPRELAFKRLNGDPGSLPLVHQMQHVVNHATLHRGQVVGMIRQLGITPPATDLLFYLMARRQAAS